MPLSGKAALVTGGSRGIGRAIVQRLARDGAQVVFSYQSNDDAADSVVEAVRAGGGAAHAVRADQGDLDAVRALLDTATDRLGGLDILVNNAAASEPAPIDDVTEADFDRVMTINAKAPFFAIQHAGRTMRDDGRIVSISTLNTVIPGPGGALYTASKAALERFTAIAARELGPRRITVNAISPGAIDTDLLRSTNPPEALALAETYSALGRLGQPADIADVVAFLAGPDSRFITGQNLRVTGGYLI
ncbi:glucose 1-dehydrogenase [Jiangella alba]|uniref:3-oxoacyl-[acyl-carrier protein] reductase n=1 Tax=Jiangella alba TaxID=561176 RepID=A0A1H5PW64_9ACTN|nr:glucose 1-dehydrogenase [Jiangella alba]SEF17441.1 3-oxoacyl-[acyl-carrier protein] reductase [Jiangella alba]